MNNLLPQPASHSQPQKDLNMEDIIQRLSASMFGTWASFSLQNVDALASIMCSLLVSVLTVISIYKILNSK